MKKFDKIFITSHERMPGCAFVRNLREKGFDNLILKTDLELDLLDQSAVSSFFQKERPGYVFLTSIKSGGIQANIDHPAEFLYDNLQAQSNVIHFSMKSKVKKLLFVSASCVYPKDCPQPMKEEYLLTGPLEVTSEPYAIAKIAGMKMCEYYNRCHGSNFISVIPATIYGPGDKFDVKNSHVISALIKKIHEAKVKKEAFASIWGSGKALREFIYADDFVDACLFLMENYNSPETINVGTGLEVSILELANMIKGVIGFKGELRFDAAKPEGSMQKLLDSDRLHSLKWNARIDLEAGIQNTHRFYTKS